MPKTRYSGGQIKWGDLIQTICCGGLKTSKPHSGVPWFIIPYSGVIVIYSAEGIHSGARSYVLRRAREMPQSGMSTSTSTRAHMKPKACAKHSCREEVRSVCEPYGHGRKR